MKEKAVISGVILGKVPSKSNSYKVVTIKGHGSIAKTEEMKAYERSFYLQCKHRGAKISGMFSIKLNVFFPSQRQDLDGSLKAILDCFQKCEVIKNDRSCVDIHARKFIDKENPRIEYLIEEL